MRLGSKSGRVAWGLWAISVAMGAVAIGLTVAANTIDISWDDVVVATVFPTVGAIIASRHPRNSVGWMLCIAGLFSQTNVFSAAYAGFSQSSHSLPAETFVVWINTWCWIPSLAIISLLFLLNFPDGRPASPKWKWANIAAIVLIVAGVTTVALTPFSVTNPSFHLHNPLGVRWLADHSSQLGITFGASYLFLGIVAIASLVVRLRRATGDERQQMKWFVYGASLLIVSLSIATLTSLDISMVGVIALATAPCVAILRYRLYDIDRIINRTVVYALVTGFLAATYLGLVLLLQLLLPTDGQSPVVVAISTLVVAAVFRPALSRIQGFIDRRFNRARYDAQRVSERFGSSLRDAVDMEFLVIELERAVVSTVQPRAVTLWLREPSR